MPWFAFEKNCLVPNSRCTFLDFLASKLNDANRVKKVRLEFETKQIRKRNASISEPNNFMRIIDSNKVRLEFELRIVEFQTPGNAHF